jgi:hypothetical protein
MQMNQQSIATGCQETCSGKDYRNKEKGGHRQKEDNDEQKKIKYLEI